MTHTITDQHLKIITWNLNRSSVSRFRKQLTALKERTPDIIALQEVGVKASRKPRKLLREHGFEYVAHSHEFHLEDAGNSSGVAFASRWPFRILGPDTFDMPGQHHALSAVFHTPFGQIEGHTVHVLPGSTVGEMKVEMFEGIFDHLAQDDPADYRFLCGDFNSPKTESADGDVTVWGTDERKISAERSVMVDLADYDLADAYRRVNGYGDDEYSWVAKNRGNEFPRRFDHVFASELLGATNATYLHQFDDLSDHTPLEVVSKPASGLHEEAERIDRTSTKPSENRAEADQTPSRVINGLAYNDDVRMVDPDANYRRGRFKAGWNAAVNGSEMGQNSLGKILAGD